MALTVGGNMTSGGSNMFLRPEENGTKVFLAAETQKFPWTSNMVSFFVKNGAPCNATWDKLSKDDPNDVYGLGGKLSTVYWVPVVVKEGDGWVAKWWQTNKTIVKSLEGIEEDADIVGMYIKISKVAGKWAFNQVPTQVRGASVEVPSASEISEALEKLTVSDLQKAIGPSDAQGVKDLLIKRCDVSNWNQVLEKFGKGGVAGDDEEDELM